MVGWEKRWPPQQDTTPSTEVAGNNPGWEINCNAQRSHAKKETESAAADVSARSRQTGAPPPSSPPNDTRFLYQEHIFRRVPRTDTPRGHKIHQKSERAHGESQRLYTQK